MHMKSSTTVLRWNDCERPPGGFRLQRLQRACEKLGIWLAKGTTTMFTQVSDARSDPDFSLVVPCYNEEAVVSHTIGKLLDAFQRAGYRLELILVDNGSTDRTGEILRGWADRNPAVVHHKVEKNE